MTRPMQASLLPDLCPDRPVGPLVGSVIGGTNADVVAAVAPLYLTGSVCDVTYGNGGWWRRYRPEQLVAHDLDPSKGDGVDFTALPEPDGTYDAVCFDPPYIPAGGYDSSTQQNYRDSYGLRPMSQAGLWNLIDAGLGECARVVRPGGWVLTKCMDFVTGGRFNLGHLRVITTAKGHGLSVHDLIVHHGGSGPGGHNIIKALRARRHHSYLLVFTKGGP